MSAYITQLDILGFDGGAAAWTQKVNTVETGGSGGAMSASCFTLDLTNEFSSYNWNSSVVRVEDAEFQSNRIRLNTDIKPDGAGTALETHYLVLTVKPEYEGQFPDSISIRATSQYTAEGLWESDDTPLSIRIFDENAALLGQWFYALEYEFYGLIDSGEQVITLTYPTTILVWDEELEEEVEIPYESPGFYSILCSRYSYMAS